MQVRAAPVGCAILRFLQLERRRIESFYFFKKSTSSDFGATDWVPLCVRKLFKDNPFIYCEHSWWYLSRLAFIATSPDACVIACRLPSILSLSSALPYLFTLSLLTRADNLASSMHFTSDALAVLCKCIDLEHNISVTIQRKQHPG